MWCVRAGGSERRTPGRRRRRRRRCGCAKQRVKLQWVRAAPVLCSSLCPPAPRSAWRKSWRPSGRFLRRARRSSAPPALHCPSVPIDHALCCNMLCAVPAITKCHILARKHVTSVQCNVLRINVQSPYPRAQQRAADCSKGARVVVRTVYSRLTLSLKTMSGSGKIQSCCVSWAQDAVTGAEGPAATARWHRLCG